MFASKYTSFIIAKVQSRTVCSFSSLMGGGCFFGGDDNRSAAGEFV